MAITAEMVKKLREETGLPMMDCKKALEEAAGDFEKAKDILRKQGHGRMAKMASREAAEGRVATHCAGGVAGIAELRCESAPVAGTADFVRLAAAAAAVAAGMDAPTTEAVLASKLPDDGSKSVGELLGEVFNRIRENMNVKRVSRLAAPAVGEYSHHDGRQAAIIGMSAACDPGIMRDICMHIVSMKPRYVKREDVPAADVEREKSNLLTEVRNDEKSKGKPEQVLAKIVDGKLGRWFSEFVLLEQPYVRDDKQSVGQFLRSVSPTLGVQSFVRFEIGA